MMSRTTVIMMISLYASRIVLSELGVVDFGIYALVAGIVSLFTFLTSSLSQGTQRFLNFEIGRKDNGRARGVFETSFKIHIFLSIVIIAISESLGLWFLTSHASIPEARMGAALIVYQFAIASTVLIVLQVPCTAALTATEKFNVFAYFDIGFSLLRLISALLLVGSSCDKLVYYGALTFFAAAIITAGKYYYCKQRIDFCCFKGSFDRGIFLDLVGFTGWSLFGTVAMVLNVQGAGVALNVFFGPTLNAAQSVAVQVANATSTMGANLQIVAAPQIVKTYSSGDHESFQSLIEKSARFSFFIMLILCAPIIAEADFLFFAWLQTPPEFSVEIAQILLVTATFTSLSLPLMSAAQASGRIKKYQIVVGSTMLLSLPIGIVLVSIGAGPLYLFFSNLAATIISLCLRLLILRSLVRLSVAKFARNSLCPALLCSLVVSIFVFLVSGALPDHSAWPLFNILIIILGATVSVWFAGLSASERSMFLKWVSAKIER